MLPPGKIVINSIAKAADTLSILQVSLFDHISGFVNSMSGLSVRCLSCFSGTSLLLKMKFLTFWCVCVCVCVYIHLHSMFVYV